MADRTPNPDELTRPERAAQFAQARRTCDKVKGAGGCFFCLHRDRETEGWDRAVCGLHPPQTFPNCQFSPDNQRLYSPERIE